MDPAHRWDKRALVAARAGHPSRVVVAAVVACVTCVALGCETSGGDERAEVSVTRGPIGGAAGAPTPPSWSAAPYIERSVQFRQPSGGFDLAGTLTVPTGGGPFPGVVLVTGSGTQDRDETIGNIKPFRVLADGLARRGIVVLRFDDRGAGQSQGPPVELSGATTVDLAQDARAAIQFLAAQPEVFGGQVGVIGHSEGALIAAVAANDEPDTVSHIVLLAGSAVPGAELLERQHTDILTTEGVSSDIAEWAAGWHQQMVAVAASDLGDTEAHTEIRTIADAAIANAPPGAILGDPTAEIDVTIAAFTDPWMRFFLAYDPAPALRTVRVPVLALFGELDVQVAADVNAAATKAALVNSPRPEVVILDGLNHLFQPARTGAVSEYETLGQPFPTDTLALIADRIVAQ